MITAKTAAGCTPVSYTHLFIEMYPGVETDNSRMFAKNNIKVNARFFATDNLAAYSMVSEGLGITLSLIHI